MLRTSNLLVSAKLFLIRYFEVLAKRPKARSEVDYEKCFVYIDCFRNFYEGDTVSVLCNPEKTFSSTEFIFRHQQCIKDIVLEIPNLSLRNRHCCPDRTAKRHIPHPEQCP